MTTIISGSSPSITFSDSTTQTTAANITSPYTSSGVVYASSTTALATGSAVTWTGTNFGISTTSNTTLSVRNTAAGTGNFSQFNLGNDTDGGVLYMQSFSSTYTTSGTGLNIQNGSLINGEGPGGLNLAATQAPIRFFSGGPAERMRLDSSGNLGLGVTPSTWTAYTALQIGNASVANYSATGDFNLLSNAYYQSSNFRYITSSIKSSRIQLASGGFGFQISTDGTQTAGSAISYTQAMTLDNSGTLCVNTTSDASGMNGTAKFALGQMGIKTMSAAFSTTIDTGIPVNQGANGGTLMLMLSGHTSDGFSTASCLYIIQFPYNGDYTPAKYYIGGSGDCLTVGTTGSAGNKTLTLNASVIVTYTFFMCT